MKTIRYVNIARILKEEEVLGLVMEQMAKGKVEYKVRKVSVDDVMKIELFNEKNILALWVKSGKEVSDDLVKFFKMYIESEADARNRILATLEALDMMYKYSQPEMRSINVLETIEGVGDITAPLVKDESEVYLYSKSDEEVFEYLMNETEFYENEQSMISYVFIEDEYSVEDLKELLKETLNLSPKASKGYETIGQMFLDEHEKVIKTKYGYFYADVMM